MDILKLNEYYSGITRTHLPSYEEAVEICKSTSKKDVIFYESKVNIDGYDISIFNYRFANYNDFIDDKINYKEMRGLTFVFNKDGSYKRYLLLEKFFNLNQVPETMYNIVKDYKIKYINNKEDGSIASFIRLPNGRVLGKSKMSFESEQADGINRIYKNNPSIKEFVDWTLDNNISAVFEYVAPHNRIVLRYTDEELILLKIRDNTTGKHIDIKDHFDKIGDIRIAPFEEDKSLDELVELMAVQTDKEGCVVHAQDENGHDFFFKLKTAWYCERHGLLTNDLYREHILIGYILDEKIDDVLGQVPEDEIEARDRINKLIDIAREEINSLVEEMDKLHADYLEMKKEHPSDYLRKFFVQKYKKHKMFYFAMQKIKALELSEKPESEWIDYYTNYDSYQNAVDKGDSFELAKESIRKKCSKLETCRKWLKEKDPSLFFVDKEEDEEEQ